jgi:hypothetical protein
MKQQELFKGIVQRKLSWVKKVQVVGYRPQTVALDCIFYNLFCNEHIS